ncbi:4-carboxymuconolactone decarboxylase domain/alkylhydroperoxidase AhpD family core domain protein [[Actinomadura] parvosata subsp. kistnae]|uniref:Alkylhydroperoxidase n=2 Tax=Nonomuraea TaxID=83681 RepID=A0A1V0AI51_9ACTN|nr:MULTISPECIES: carboxymuconolactone decarboxylase family protein [unclassified Nonomuraea]AQZ69886.1 alkylhydroperoxidase [Nonomuraea sp. ATCC 55076]NJP95239.1 carboxymuconolactone decarboxylase family protein [Nonomuraea sp. FMUSA5-5]SPL90204.1 4-carboxymuconolactone decarboxylase domain/alkylhydroperoxidase AhpD family core domain protein [Actinomadura parvosata subsp. kistnae]
MTQRINVAQQVPQAFHHFLAVEKLLHESELPTSTLELVKLRASQINGCAYCVDMHSRDMKKAGESDERLWMVAAWREATVFTPEERAALALTEEACRLADREAVPDAVWQQAAEHYSDKQLGLLIVALAMINAWNRINVIARTTPGQ